jgi:excinuclease ABC subunit A
MQQRLAESFEAALRLAEGRAIALELGAEGVADKEHLFNAKFACPICHYSLAELEPRLFSFNSPVGACPACDGLGHREFFDPRGGGLPSPHGQRRHQGWDRRNGYYFSMVEASEALPVRHHNLQQLPASSSVPAAREEDIKFSYDGRAFGWQEADAKHPSKDHSEHGAPLPKPTRPWCARTPAAMCSPARLRRRATAPRRATCSW